MPTPARRALTAPCIAALLLLQACSDSEAPMPSAPEATEPPAQESTTVAPEDAPPPAPGGDSVVTDPAPATPATETVDSGAAEAQQIDPDTLQKAGTIELRQYTVAWVGSGTMGGGTLVLDEEEHPFRIAGLGVGGFGASALNATGTVYNLPSLDAFPGTYGNARLGMTAGESGSGRLWLRNPDGVVIELESEMRGLALSSGVDGILIQWDDGEDSELDRVRDGSEEAVGGAIEAGADAVESGVNKVKGWLKKDG